MWKGLEQRRGKGNGLIIIISKSKRYSFKRGYFKMLMVLI